MIEQSMESTAAGGLRHQIIVAGVVERAGRYLVIEEMADGRRVINQPAGRLECNEDAAAGQRFPLALARHFPNIDEAAR